jgi:hypothetical protein
MSRTIRVQHFDSEGRENLPDVIRNVKAYLKSLQTGGRIGLPKIVFLTAMGEGPMMAYSQLGGLNVRIIAVTFPPGFSVKTKDGQIFEPKMPEKVMKFFRGVEIPVISSRLPFDTVTGAESHNKEMALLRSSISIFGGSMPLAVQAVLQAADHGLIAVGEEVIAVTSDTAALITASTTEHFLSNTSGMLINEIICKPSVFSISRRRQMARPRELSGKSGESES